jgi:hypothetical protein
MTRLFKWLDNLFFGRRRRFLMALANISGELKEVNEGFRDAVRILRAVLEKTTENMSAAQQALVRAMGAFERSDVTFEKVGRLADKMAAREAALEEALISIGKLKIEEAKVKSLEAEELKKDLQARPYDDKF